MNNTPFFKLIFKNVSSIEGFGFIVLLFITLCAVIVRYTVFKRLQKRASLSASPYYHFIAGLVGRRIIPLLYIIMVFLIVNNLGLRPALQRIFSITGSILFTILIVRILLSVLSFSLDRYLTERDIDLVRKKTLKALFTGIQVIVWIIAVILLLDNLGVKISTLVAGLGIGGIAIALASQTLLGDLFGYAIIFFDRPFKIGDFIIVDNYMGKVEEIGIKTTRIRSLDGEMLIFRNTDLTGSRIKNYENMEKRRAIFTFTVSYSTPASKLRSLTDATREIISRQPLVTFDRAHLKTFGETGLIFEVVYFVLDSDYNKYMDIQHEINLLIKETCEKLSIPFVTSIKTAGINIIQHPAVD